MKVLVDVETNEHALTGAEEKEAMAKIEQRVANQARKDERELQEGARMRLESVER